MVRDSLTGSRALWRLYQEGRLGNEYQDYKVHALFVHNPGRIHAATKRIVTPADLKAVRLRAPNKTVAAALDADIAFYTAAFFVVMNKATFDGLPADIRAAIDQLSNEALVTRFGQLWNKWDQPVRNGAAAAGHEIIIPDAVAMAQWRRVLRPVAAARR